MSNLTLYILRCFFLSYSIISFVASCKHGEACLSREAPQKTFASPDDAAKALMEAAKSENREDIAGDLRARFEGDHLIPATPSGQSVLRGILAAYDVMHRWRKLDDGSEVLLVGTDNRAFPNPLEEE